MITGNCAVIILAAGSSTRMGSPKQLLIYRNKSLLEHSVDSAIDAGANPVIVVLGANAALIRNNLDAQKVHVADNKDWKEGMGSSVRCGIDTLLKLGSSADAVILMLCDQPHVSASLIKELIATQKSTGKPIIASQYQGTIGAPALFCKTIFSELLDLKGDAGARQVISRHRHETGTVLFDKGNIDIDTEADYRALG